MPKLKKQYYLDLLVEVVTKDSHINDTLPNYFRDRVCLIIEFDFYWCIKRPHDFYFLWSFPPLAHRTPSEIMKFIDLSSNAYFQR